MKASIDVVDLSLVLARVISTFAQSARSDGKDADDVEECKDEGIKIG